MALLSVVFGSIVGLALGLTGGGGSLFAVPMLVYGLGMVPHDATGVSLAAVGATSFIGFLHRWKLGEVELHAGLAFAAAGMCAAPGGAWIAGRVSESLLLFLFAGLMIVVAARMWQQAARAQAEPPPPASPAPVAAEADAPRVRSLPLLLLLGVLTGVLSGLFGVGGGIVIVPALVLVAGTPIHRAVGTSLMVIALVSASSITALALAGRSIDPAVTGLFVLGGVGGLFAGQRLGRRLSGPALQKVFVFAILAVAVFVIAKNLNA